MRLTLFWIVELIVRVIGDCAEPNADRAFASLAESERISADTGLEKLDIKRTIDNWFSLTDELIHAGLTNYAIPHRIYIDSVVRSRNLAIEQHPKTRLSDPFSCAHYKMEVSGVKPISDTAILSIQGDKVFLERTLT